MSPHVYECHVRFSDVDVYGHVNNVKYFEYFQEARIAFLRDLNGGEDPWASSPTERHVLARIDVDYRRPIVFRPEPYLVETRVTRLGTSSYDLLCRICDADDGGGRGYSSAQVRMVAFDTGTQRSRPLGDDERTRLTGVLDA